MISGVVLAAGEGSRFGAPKQLAELDGRPLIEYALDAVWAVPAIVRIVVVLGAAADQVRAGACLDGAEVVVAEDWSEGISASLRAGVAAVADSDAALITLADQPLITSQVIAAVVGRSAARPPAARATFGGHPGHPVLIKRELFAEVAALRGDAGARDMLERSGVAKVECEHLASAHDVDTREDLEAIAGKRMEAIAAKRTSESEVRG